MTDDRVPVQCDECGQVYCARRGKQGGVVIPTSDGECGCGARSFVELDAATFDEADEGDSTASS